MTLEQLRDLLRYRLNDEGLPQLWSDTELTAYINEAEREAALRARLLYDETSGVTEIPLVVGQGTYQLSELVIAVDYVLLASTKRRLRRTTQIELDDQEPGWRQRRGTPSQFFEENTYLGLDRLPTVTDTLNLGVHRYPMEAMAQGHDEPEIAAHLHLQMLEWAVYLAYRKRNSSDEEEVDRGLLAEKEFIRYFGERPDANVLRQRRIKRVPRVKARW